MLPNNQWLMMFTVDKDGETLDMQGKCYLVKLQKIEDDELVPDIPIGGCCEFYWLVLPNGAKRFLVAVPTNDMVENAIIDNSVRGD